LENANLRQKLVEHEQKIFNLSQNSKLKHESDSSALTKAKEKIQILEAALKIAESERTK